MQIWGCLQKLKKAFWAYGKRRMDESNDISCSLPSPCPTPPILHPLVEEKATKSKSLSWKERKSLSNLSIPPAYYTEKIVPFSNRVYMESATEHTAAIQFCIGNSSKIPSTLDKEFNAALRAEGYDLNNLKEILRNVYNCAALGRDTCGKRMAYETITPLIHASSKNDAHFYGMKRVNLFVEKDWKGTCMLMVIKRTHRLFRNRNNCIMGFVVHTERYEAAALLQRALHSLLRTKKMKIRGLLYRYSVKSNCYLDVTKSECKNLEEMQKCLGDNVELEFIK
jgi:hypothetical protein